MNIELQYSDCNTISICAIMQSLIITGFAHNIYVCMHFESKIRYRRTLQRPVIIFFINFIISSNNASVIEFKKINLRRNCEMFNFQTKYTYVIYLVLIEIITLTRGEPHSFKNDTTSIVPTVYGKIKGTALHSRNNRCFYAFKGIPFAKPPVGELRFKAPVPPDPWKDVRDATKDAPKCIQKNYLLSEHPTVEGQEDCLYLNVYTPKLPTSKVFWITPKRRSLLPVMVFMHYGAFFAGTGRSDYLGPEYFMDKDVVLVTFNYRLGVFGFLSTNDDASPGNWALKDQVAVLRWVQDNVHFFGGNNKKVTIFGQSAGAGSVHYHLLSPLSRNLFHNAISQSGTTLGLWARPKNELQEQIAKRQANLVNCDANVDSFVMVDCLRKVNASVLADTADSFKFFSTEPYVLYGPVIEKSTHLNPEPYITDDPLNLIKQGKIHRVPWIVGVVADEGILRASPLLRQPKIQSSLVENFNQFVPQVLGVTISVPENEVDSIWKRIKDFFLAGQIVNVTQIESVQGFIDLYGDRAFNYPNYQSALLHAWRGHDPIWFYNFAYRGDYSYGEHFATTEENIQFKWGVSHCDDLLYLFPSKKLFEPLKSHNDILMSKIMINLWTNFATYGNPTPSNDINQEKWESIPNLEGQRTVKNVDLIYLNITGPYKSEQGEPIKFEIRNDFLTDRMAFWESLPLRENINGIE